MKKEDYFLTNIPMTIDDVFDFMKKYSTNEKKLTVSSLYRMIKKELPHRKISYPTLLKHIDILIALEKIKCEKYEKAKIVWYEKKGVKQ